MGVAQAGMGRRNLPFRVGGEDVVLRLHDRVAGEPALGVVLLRRRVRSVAGPEGLGRGIILEFGISPSAAIRKPFAVLHHEVDVVQPSGHYWLAGLILSLLRHPMGL